MEQYGTFIIFVLVFAEYLCIPGYPGGISVPAAGIIAKMGALPFLEIYLFSVASAMLSQCLIYFVCTLFCDPIKRICEKGRHLKKGYEKAQVFIDKWGAVGVLIARLIPVARAFVSYPAGLAKMKFRQYFLYSLIGTSAYILICMALGYFAAGLFM